MLLITAHSKGAIIVCSAGNDNTDRAFYPSSYQHAVSVASISINDNKSVYSNFGPWIDISAPGGDPSDGGIFSSIPDNKYEYFQGTSMAAPVVAGLFGLIKVPTPRLEQ